VVFNVLNRSLSTQRYAWVVPVMAYVFGTCVCAEYQSVRVVVRFVFGTSGLCPSVVVGCACLMMVKYGCVVSPRLYHSSA
jgi:hypothetical protein